MSLPALLMVKVWRNILRNHGKVAKYTTGRGSVGCRLYSRDVIPPFSSPYPENTPGKSVPATIYIFFGQPKRSSPLFIHVLFSEIFITSLLPVWPIRPAHNYYFPMFSLSLLPVFHQQYSAGQFSRARTWSFFRCSSLLFRLFIRVLLSLSRCLSLIFRLFSHALSRSLSSWASVTRRLCDVSCLLQVVGIIRNFKYPDASICFFKLNKRLNGFQLSCIYLVVFSWLTLVVEHYKTLQPAYWFFLSLLFSLYVTLKKILSISVFDRLQNVCLFYYNAV